MTYDDADLEQTPTTPGMKYRHYTPDAEVVLVLQGPNTVARLWEEVARCAAKYPGHPVGVLRTGEEAGAAEAPVQAVVRWLSRGGGPGGKGGTGEAAVAAAHHLFGDLRDMEALGCRAIVVEGLQEEGQGLAVMNRLRKAASRVF